MDAIQIALAERVRRRTAAPWQGSVFMGMGRVAGDDWRSRSISAYQNMEPVRMLTILMGLSLVKAGLIIGYFMHMKFEVSAMKWMTMSSLVFCLA